MKPKTTLLLLCTAIMYLTSFAQPNIKLQQVAGGSADDNFSCLALTNDGGTIAGGTSYSGISGNKTQASRGGSDYWIVKYDKAGAIQWDKTIGSSGYERLACVQQTTDSGYILGGTSSGGVSGDKTSPLISNADYWIVKLDKNRNIQWDKTIADTSIEDLSSDEFTLYSLQQTSDKGYILAGINHDDNDDYFNTYWVVKLDSNGTKQWSQYYYANAFSRSDEVTTVIQQTPDGGYILGGSDFNRRYNAQLAQAVRIDKYGNQVWNKDYDEYITYRDDKITALVQTDNGYILGGYTDEIKYGSYGTHDYRLIEIDTAGNVLKARTIGGNGDDRLSSLEKTSDGGLLIGGYSNSDSSGNKTENSRGGYDYWIIKVNKFGQIMWDKTYGGSSDDNLFTAKERKPGEYVLGGSSLSGYSGDKTVPSRGGVDYWSLVMQYTKPAPQIVKDAAPDFSVYPSPATNKININTKSKAAFMLFTQSGRQMAYKIIEHTGSIDVSHVTPGFYFITNLSTGKKQNVIIER